MREQKRLGSTDVIEAYARVVRTLEAPEVAAALALRLEPGDLDAVLAVARRGIRVSMVTEASIAKIICVEEAYDREVVSVIMDAIA
jgi:hypothetical protein